MTIKCEFLNKEYASKEDRLKDIISNKHDLLAMKKASFKCSDGLSFNSSSNSVEKSENSTKRLEIGDTIKVVINTTNYLDSHMDVHLDGIWNKSAKEQNGKTYHVVDHNLSLGSIVGYPKDVNISIERMSWKELGYDFIGDTEALVFATKLTDKSNMDAFKAYRDSEPIQHSIRMEYVNIQLAVNDPEDKDGYKLYVETLPKIVNREKAVEYGFFFVVNEAKISKEGSTVPFGSNDITPYLGFSTQKDEPIITHTYEPIDFLGMCKKVKFK